MTGPSSPFDGPEDSPGFLLWQIANAWQRQQRAALAPLGLTHVQFVLLASLWWLTRGEAGVTQSDLARHAGADPMMTSQVVRSLARRRLVARGRDPADGRARSLSVTPAGLALVGRALPAVEAVDAAFFAPVADRRSLTAAFRRLADADGGR